MSETRANAQAAIHDLIARRWSPRAFDAEKPVEHDKLLSCLEAARWAPSCFGDEPWRFIVCDRFVDTAGWQQLFDCLAPKNQLWAGKVPVLILSCAGSRFSANGNPNRWGEYDTGAAAVSLCLQATALGLASHQMGGFDIDKVRATFNIPEQFNPMAMIAVGHQAEADILNKDFKAIELDKRKRRPLGELFFAGEWEKGFA